MLTRDLDRVSSAAMLPQEKDGVADTKLKVRHDLV